MKTWKTWWQNAPFKLCKYLALQNPDKNKLRNLAKTLLLSSFFRLEAQTLSYVPKMLTSVPILPSKLQSVFPFGHHHYHSISHKPTPIHQFSFLVQNHVNPVNSLKGSGYLSSIGLAIEQEEEYRKARAAVTRKGVDLEGYFIEGVSVGGQETCVIIPELKCAFDIGRCPSRAIQQKFVFITHAHLDHIVSLFPWRLLHAPSPVGCFLAKTFLSL